MCLIIVCPPGHTPDRDVFVETISQNHDGSGWAMRAPGNKVLWEKSATEADKMLDNFLAAREANPQEWAMWHSRLASQGTKGTDLNVHPFKVPNRPWLACHNGTLHLYDLPTPDRIFCERSDSKIFAEDCLPNWHWRELYTHQTDLEKYVATSKIVILSAGKEPKRPVFILNEAKGIWDKDDQCWYSHTLYFRNKNTYSYPTTPPAHTPPGHNHHRPTLPLDNQWEGTEWERRGNGWRSRETFLATQTTQKERELQELIQVVMEDEEPEPIADYVTDWATIAKAVADSNVTSEEDAVNAIELQAGVI